MDAITIFILIGAAHWAAHVLGCRSCRAFFLGLGVFILEGVVHVFGWPMHAAQYLVDAFGPKRPGPTKEEIEASFRDAADSLAEKLKGAGIKFGGVVECHQRPDESDEDFEARIQTTLTDAIAKRKAAANENRNANGA